jgi:hypothetical protein
MILQSWRYPSFVDDFTRRSQADLDTQATPEKGTRRPGCSSLIFAMMLSACAGTPLIYPPTPDHAGALRVAEVMGLVAGDELAEPYYEALRDSGIADSQIRSGSVAAGRSGSGKSMLEKALPAGAAPADKVRAMRASGCRTIRGCGTAFSTATG